VEAAASRLWLIVEQGGIAYAVSGAVAIDTVDYDVMTFR
jgi:hypothetical protein